MAVFEILHENTLKKIDKYSAIWGKKRNEFNDRFSFKYCKKKVEFSTHEIDELNFPLLLAVTIYMKLCFVVAFKMSGSSLMDWNKLKAKSFCLGFCQSFKPKQTHNHNKIILYEYLMKK